MMLHFQSSIIYLPFAILALTAFSLGFSLIISVFAVYFPDVAEMYPIVLTAWMYLTPIIYPEKLMEGVLNGWVLILNPIFHLIKLFRLIVFDGISPTISEFSIAFGIGFGTLMLGWLFFTNNAKKFAYYV